MKIVKQKLRLLVHYNLFNYFLSWFLDIILIVFKREKRNSIRGFRVCK